MDQPAKSVDETLAPDTTANTLTNGGPRASWANAISLAEAGLLTDVSIVFDLAWIYVPVLGTAFIPLVPAPFTILYLRRGARITLFAACVAGFLMTVLVGPHYGWRLTLEAIIGMTMGWAMRHRWPPTLAILLTLFLNATVAYVAAFSAVFALALPLHDLYSELHNMLKSLAWLLDTSAIWLGLRTTWLGVRPVFAAAAHIALTYWIPMFYLYVVALSLPTVVLYYAVASTTASALGHDVRTFPPQWVWRAFRALGLILSPIFWLARLVWLVVTAPLWGPVRVARALARRRRTDQLRRELAATPSTQMTSDAASAGEPHEGRAALVEAAHGGEPTPR